MIWLPAISLASPIWVRSIRSFWPTRIATSPASTLNACSPGLRLVDQETQRRVLGELKLGLIHEVRRADVLRARTNAIPYAKVSADLRRLPGLDLGGEITLDLASLRLDEGRDSGGPRCCSCHIQPAVRGTREHEKEAQVPWSRKRAL